LIDLTLKLVGGDRVDMLEYSQELRRLIKLIETARESKNDKDYAMYIQ
jgi:hypothetical protein